MGGIAVKDERGQRDMARDLLLSPEEPGDKVLVCLLHPCSNIEQTSDNVHEPHASLSDFCSFSGRAKDVIFQHGYLHQGF